MSTIDRQVGVTRRRLTLVVALRALTLAILVASCFLSLAVIAERTLGLGYSTTLAGLAAGLLAVGVLVVQLARQRISPLQAAVTLDQAAALKERLSTALAVRTSDDPFAAATVHDAERVAAKVHVPQHIRVQAPPLWPWATAAVIAMAIVIQFMPRLDLLAASEQPQDPAAELEQAQVIKARLSQRIEQMRQRVAQRPELAELEKELEQLKLPDRPTATPEDIRREALKRIERVEDKLRSEAEKLDALARLKRELSKLRPSQGNDAASKLSQALQAGDLRGARQALEQLKQQLAQAAADSDPQTRRKLAEMQRQLEQLSKQLERLAQSDKALKDLQNKGGLSEQQARELMKKLAGKNADQIARELQKALKNSGLTQQQIKQLAQQIARNQQLQQQLRQMARACRQAAQACRQGQSGQSPGQSGQSAQRTMQQAINQLSELEIADQLMNELQAQLSELQNLKAGVCQGQWSDPNSIACKPGGTGPRPGLGYGAGTGKKRTGHAYKTVRPGTKPTEGQIIGEILVDAPLIKGSANAEVRAAVAAALRDAEDAVEREHIERQYEQAVRAYFERLAGLLQQRAAQNKAAGQPQSDQGDKSDAQDKQADGD